jgi:hypothetical protein
MENLSARELIVKTLKEKSSLKQDVYYNTLSAFNTLKSVAKSLIGDLQKEAKVIDKRLILEFKDKGEFEFELRVAGDLLIFVMHTNVFEFDKNHSIWKNSYVKQDISGLIAD